MRSDKIINFALYVVVSMIVVAIVSLFLSIIAMIFHGHLGYGFLISFGVCAVIA